MNFSEKGCWNCRFEDCDELEEPCVFCKNNFIPYTKEYEDAELLWQPPVSETDNDDISAMVKNILDGKPTDNVNHPSHYTQGGMECIDEMLLIFGKEAVKHFCVCNAWKYRKRAMFKNGQEDIDKSDWYINKYKELSADGTRN